MAQYKGYAAGQSDLERTNMKMDFDMAFANRIVEIEFLKVDGTERKMKATTNSAIIESLVGPKVENTEKKVRKENDSVCRVFDVEAKAWRSFKWDNLILYSNDDYC
jgi:hypothetical protein